MPENELATTVHSLLHGAQPAICSTDWAEMTGDNCMRKCDECGAVAFHAERMDAGTFCAEAEKLRTSDGAMHAFRRADGTYTFSNRHCSPKQFLAPLKSELRGAYIANWWCERHGRYNQRLFYYGLTVGGGTSILLVIASLFVPGGGVTTSFVAVSNFVVQAFLMYGLGCAIVANLIYGLCMLLNLAVPGIMFLAPVRRHMGPCLLATSIGIMGFAMTLPLIITIGLAYSSIVHR